MISSVHVLVYIHRFNFTTDAIFFQSGYINLYPKAVDG